MTGLVLCGGQSRRMGSDKGLLQQETLTWAEVTAGRFKALQLPFVLSVNEQQYPGYSEKFKQFRIIKDDPSLDVYGPLKGILSIHIQLAGENLLVLACDMPSMKIEPLDYLVQLSLVRNEDAFAFQNDAHVEPVCAIYTSRGLKKIYDQYKAGQLKKHNLHYVLESLDTFYVPVLPEWKRYFNNYNSPEDLSSL